MTDEQILEEFEEVSKLFFVACGYVELNNIFDYNMAHKINKLEDGLICQIGLMVVEFNQNGELKSSHPAILEIYKQLVELGILEKKIDTQEVEFTPRIPGDQILDLRKEIYAATRFWFQVTEKIEENPQRILEESDQINFLIRYVTRMGTMAGYWIPKIYKKFLKLDADTNRILLSLQQPKKFYKRLEGEALKKDGIVIKDYVKKLMDEGMIQETINEDVMYLIKPYRDFKNIAWPDFKTFADPVLYKFAELEGKLKEKS